jgi:phage gp29-like protein
MSPEASTEDAAVYELYKKIMRNIHVGQESGLILPMFRDDVKGEKQFEFEIVNSTGQKSYDVEAIIKRLNKEILTTLYADFLIMGQDGGGSFALSESKLSVVQIIIRSKLAEIRDVLNHHLVPMLFKANGWKTEVYPTFEFDEVSKPSLAEFAKAWQQISATMGIAKTAKNINYVAERMGLPDMVPEDISKDALFELLSGGESRVGDGMKSGLGSGTGNATGSSGDGTAGNSQNN